MVTMSPTTDPGIRIRTSVREAEPKPAVAATAIEMKDVTLSYGDNQVLHGITMDIADRQVTAFIGPSGLSLIHI